MSNTKSSNQAAVPEAKGALDRFKFEVANELGVPLTDGYNGNLTSKQNGSVGGYMVNNMYSEQPRPNPVFSSIQCLNRICIRFVYPPTTTQLFCQKAYQ